MSSMQGLSPVTVAPTDDAQPLVGFMANDEWDALLAEVTALVEQMQSLPAGEPKTAVFRLLDGIDAIHREALHRLVRLFKEGVLEKVVSDPAIHTLMELYDLLPLDEEADAEPAPEDAAGKPRFPTIPIFAVRSTPAQALRYPHWVPVLAQRDDLAPGMVNGDVVADGVALLLARRDDRLFALEAQCAVDGASLRGASLSGYLLSCPQHAGCHYDVRNGARRGGGNALVCYPVKIDDAGRVMAGFDMDFKPDLPSF